MQFVLSPSLLHLYFISYVSHCINSCGLFLPSADNYFSLLGFVIIACFLLATLSIDNILQILDRCWGICSGDMVRRIITALFSSPEINKQIPFLALCTTSESALCFASLQLWAANYDVRWVARTSVPLFTSDKTRSVSNIFPFHPLSFAQYLLLLWPFYIHLALFHLLAITTVAQVLLHSLV